MPEAVPEQAQAGDRLAQIQERCQKATPGPWYAIKTTKAGKTFEYSNYPFEIPDDLLSPDQGFVNHAREDIPWLLHELALARDLASQRGIMLDEATAKLAEARKDSERLDWLEGERERELKYLNQNGPYVPALFRTNMPITRVAIDAARGKP